MIAAYAAALIAILQATTPSDERANVRQLALKIPADASPTQKTELREQLTSAVTDTPCDQLSSAATAIGAEFTSRDEFLLREMPVPLRDQLAGKPAGTVTSVFGETDGKMMILVRC